MSTVLKNKHPDQLISDFPYCWFRNTNVGSREFQTLRPSCARLSSATGRAGTRGTARARGLSAAGPGTAPGPARPGSPGPHRSAPRPSAAAPPALPSSLRRLPPARPRSAPPAGARPALTAPLRPPSRARPPAIYWALPAPFSSETQLPDLRR